MRIIFAAALTLLTTLAFAGERLDSLRHSVRASVLLSDFTSGYKDIDKRYDITLGYGFGIGYAATIPITGPLSFAPEANLLYRRIYRYTDPGIAVEFELDSYKVWATEFAFSIPLLLRYSPSILPAYIQAGVQADIPFNSKFAFSEKGRDATLEFKDRTMMDFGVVAGLGYKITERFSVDGRATIGLTKINKDKDGKSSFSQYAIGIAYTFPLPKKHQEKECPLLPQQQEKAEEKECPQLPQQQEKAEEVAEEKISQHQMQEEAEEKLETLSSNTITVSKDTRGTVISMSDILFESGKASLKDELKMNLTEIAGILKNFLSESSVVIEGHTDNIGSAERNQLLSEQRAGAVLQFLVSCGVNKSQLASVGYGFSKPLADNSTEKGRAKNRRVEIIIKEAQ